MSIRSLPYILVVAVLLAVWSLYARQQFGRFDVRLKRGVRVWSEALTPERRQWLAALSGSVWHGAEYIRREGAEILISEDEKYSFWGSFFGRKKVLVYIGYVNLALGPSRLELRMPLPDAIGLSLLLAGGLGLTGYLFLNPNGEGWPGFLGPGLPAGGTIFLLASIVLNHFRERKRLLDILARFTALPRS